MTSYLQLHIVGHTEACRYRRLTPQLRRNGCVVTTVGADATRVLRATRDAGGGACNSPVPCYLCCTVYISSGTKTGHLATVNYKVDTKGWPIARPHRMPVVDAAYCCIRRTFCGLYVCLLGAGHTDEPRKYG